MLLSLSSGKTKPTKKKDRMGCPALHQLGPASAAEKVENHGRPVLPASMYLYIYIYIYTFACLSDFKKY